MIRKKLGLSTDFPTQTDRVALYVILAFILGGYLF